MAAGDRDSSDLQPAGRPVCMPAPSIELSSACQPPWAPVVRSEVDPWTLDPGSRHVYFLTPHPPQKLWNERNPRQEVQGRVPAVQIGCW